LDGSTKVLECSVLKAYPALIALKVLPIIRSREVHAPVTARYVRSC